LTLSASRWVPTALSAEDSADTNSPEIVDRKVKGLLNKLTVQNFDGISDQIIAWTNKSEMDQDARILGQVTRLIIEHAMEDEARSEIYARLCRKASEQTSGLVRDEVSINLHGKPMTSGQLFRKYLLKWCRDNFELLCTAENGDRSSVVIALYSDEYYATRKAKRQGLGLTRFIGELFKLKMLTERHIHECVKRLLHNVSNPGQTEYLCKLLATVGSILDTIKARAHMDVYFSRMKELTRSPNSAPRIRFMLQVSCLLSSPALIALPDLGIGCD
jgi:translation initiation factor 4G